MEAVEVAPLAIFRPMEITLAAGNDDGDPSSIQRHDGPSVWFCASSAIAAVM
jgi:hypothetical protein